MNALLAHKATRGLSRRAEFPDAIRADVDTVLTAITGHADALQTIDARAASHLREQVHPLVTAYAKALERAGYPPSAFFSRTFTIDIGQIVNQGRAQGLFRGLAATNGEPMTPREERGFGQASLSTIRGPIWRITRSHTRQPVACRSRSPAGRTPRPRRRACWWKNSTLATSPQ